MLVSADNPTRSVVRLMCVPLPRSEADLKLVVHRAHVKNLFAGLVLLVCAAAAFAQQPQPDKKPVAKDTKTQTTKPGAKLPFVLTVKTGPFSTCRSKPKKQTWLRWPRNCQSV